MMFALSLALSLASGLSVTSNSAACCWSKWGDQNRLVAHLPVPRPALLASTRHASAYCQLL